MKNGGEGISLISLIITIIVIIILAAIVIFSGLNTPDRANFAKYVQEVSDARIAIVHEYADMKTKNAIENKTRSDAQIYYTMATGNEIDMNDDTSTLKVGTIEEIEFTTLPNTLVGSEFYEVTENIKIGGWSNSKGYYEQLGTEKHYITDKGEFFILPGYRVDDGATTKWYVNESKYYISNEPVRISEGDNIDLSVDTTWQEVLEFPQYNYNWYTLDVEKRTLTLRPNGPRIGKNIEIKKYAVIDGTKYETKFPDNCGGLFAGCSMESIIIDKNIDTSNVISFTGMFSGCYNLSNVVLTNLVTNSAQNLSGMFSACTAISNLEISGWDTSNVEDLSGMFAACRSLTNIDISSWDTNNVTNMSGMFIDCTSLTNIIVSNKFVTTKVVNGEEMFDGCSSIVGGEGTEYSSSNIDAFMAHIDGGTSNPGYFTSN